MGVREIDRSLEQWQMGIKDLHRRTILAPTPRKRGYLSPFLEEPYTARRASLTVSLRVIVWLSVASRLIGYRLHILANLSHRDPLSLLFRRSCCLRVSNVSRCSRSRARPISQSCIGGHHSTRLFRIQ